MQIFINYKQNVQPDHDYARELEKRLSNEGHKVFRDETGIKPSQEWAKRLYREISSCDTLVSLVSNEALSSTWCLTEIDFALKEGKRLLPIVLEEISKELDFQAFKPRFMLTQWHKSNGNLDEDFPIIKETLKENPNLSIVKMVKQVCDEHSIDDPAELFTSLFNAMQQTHFLTSIGSPNPHYFDGMQGVTGPVNSIAESVSKLVTVAREMNRQNSGNSLKHGNEYQSKSFAWQAQRDACFVEIFSKLMDDWNQRGKIIEKELEVDRKKQ